MHVFVLCSTLTRSTDYLLMIYGLLLFFHCRLSVCVITCWNHTTQNINTQGRTCFNNSFIVKTCMSHEIKGMILSDLRVWSFPSEENMVTGKIFLSVCFQVSHLFLNFHISSVGRGKIYSQVFGLSTWDALHAVHFIRIGDK